MVIHFKTHQQIDKQQWDHLLGQCSHALIYARSIYLDHMSPGWCALISDDERYIMPLTCKRKWGIRYLYQPPFCQQLGIFGSEPVTQDIAAAFMTAARQRFRFSEIFINADSKPNASMVASTHKNYVLDLSKSYEVIREGYTNDLVKKNLQRTIKFNLSYVSSDDVKGTMDTYRQLYADRTPHVTPEHYRSFVALAEALHGSGHAFIRKVELPNGELLACGLFLKDEQRIYNIASSTLPNGRTFEANHVLFDRLIQEFADSGLLLDLEGSDIPGIERFYRKFGAVDQPYHLIRWNDLPWPMRLLKR